ncbi:hypothetical protein ACH5RR_018571 [Cinchona calisaya]|uniref:Uncharacterized protein n=1 Tax=Cinchona calisaya TaxID=153742 RepID=A0ABD2ZLV5_9GENT
MICFDGSDIIWPLNLSWKCFTLSRAVGKFLQRWSEVAPRVAADYHRLRFCLLGLDFCWAKESNEFYRTEEVVPIFRLHSLSITCEASSTIIEELVHVWNCNHSVFCFGKQEIMVTLEEVSSLLDIPFHGLRLIYPTEGGLNALCQYVGLKRSKIPRADRIRVATSSYLGFQNCFGWNDSVSIEDGKICFKMAKMMCILYQGIGGQSFTLLPNIAAQIFVACTNSQDKGAYFTGSNLILQVWAFEPLTKRPGLTQGSGLIRDWVMEHRERYNSMDKQGTTAQWVSRLQALEEDQIQ